MISWRAQGILISLRRHGESAAIIEVLTESQGRVAGVVRGGGGRKMAPILQPGAQLDVTWRARLEEHLGHFTVEPIRARAPALLGQRAALAGLNALCAMLRYVLAEREAVPAIYARATGCFDALPEPALWPLAYLSMEMALLDHAGIGLELEVCAVTGAEDGLAYISPKTGAAVSAAGAGDWAPRLLPLAPALLGQASGAADVRAALDVLSHFWEHKFAHEIGAPVPAARARLIDVLA